MAKAKGGTLFLDEIGDLPLSLQPKFLRFVQFQKYKMVGDTEEKDADVRIIAATNKILSTRQEGQENQLREDLIYRFPCRVQTVPLREQREVIPFLLLVFPKALQAFKLPWFAG